MTKRNIYVDADACPVKDEIGDLSLAYNTPAVFVASYTHKLAGNDDNWVYVDPDRESADLYIVNHAQRNDITVTQDMGLASLLTGKGVHVLTPTGKYLNESDMSMILHTRHLRKKALKAGQKIKGPKAFSQEDRARFSQSLEELLIELETKE